jgi:hypothetical protein
MTDVHEFLNRAIVAIAKNPSFDWEHEALVLNETYLLILSLIGEKAFFRNARKSLALYESASLGTSRLIELNKPMDLAGYTARFAELKNDPELDRYSGAGVRGTDRWRGFVTAKAHDYFTK